MTVQDESGSAALGSAWATEPQAVPRARPLLQALSERRLHKRALMADWKKIGRKERKEAENGELAEVLSSRCGCDVLVSPPDAFKSRTTIAMLMPAGPMPLEEASPLVGSLQNAAEARAQLLIAAPEKNVKKVEQVAKKELGI
ncbi:MAG: hypothetical protein M1530_00685 [Candidatus Marsarchaeota archaeon]|nr:hypothetical protein [Candidatus Marsarchaeota archaeon]